MSNVTPAISLSTNGWVVDPNGKIDTLLAHWYESEKSQTALYGSNVASLQHVVQKYGSYPTELGSQIKYSLENYLSRYYDSAVVTVTDNNNALNLNGAVELKIYCEVAENGVMNSVGMLLQANGAKVSKFMKLNNG